jgi:hypothetical protein
VLTGCDILPDDQRTGRAAGVACGASGTTDVVDAIVVATAVQHQASVVTSDPVAGYKAPDGGPAPDAAKRACLGLTGLVAAAWPHAQALQADSAVQWTDFDPHLTTTVRARFPDLPPAALALALRVWGRMHGLIALELYGHLAPQAHDPARLFSAEMLDLIRSLGLEPPLELAAG